jgi:hypothetical protein
MILTGRTVRLELPPDRRDDQPLVGGGSLSAVSGRADRTEATRSSDMRP